MHTHTLPTQEGLNQRVKELSAAQDAVAKERTKLEALQEQLKARRTELNIQVRSRTGYHLGELSWESPVNSSPVLVECSVLVCIMPRQNKGPTAGV